jgi:penicillin-binding protein 2
LNIDKTQFLEYLQKDWKLRRFSKDIPFIFLNKISPEIFTRFQESLYEFPGFFLQLRSTRSYPYAVGAHVLGYISEVNADQVGRYNGKYMKGDYIGSSGLEKEYEGNIAGQKGIAYLLKDNLGRYVGPYKNGGLDSMAVSGKDVVTSLDIELQKYAEELLKGKSGAVVAIEPSTGEILAMCSGPTYDPNLLTINKARGKAFQELLLDPRKPFLDRTVMAKYPPGSIFKTLVALIGLQEGVIYPSTSMGCPHGYHYNNLFIKCHCPGYSANLPQAIGYSCNNYFCSVFRDIVDKYGFSNPKQGYDVFLQHVYDFGLGHPLGIDYPNENAGYIPTTARYDRMYPKDKGGWRSPAIVSLGIGQGELQLTTLQMANLAATIANRGYYYPPHLVKAFKDGTSIPERLMVKHKTRIDPQHFETVVDGMQFCVTTGTARNAAVPGTEMLGKTGTVQNPHNRNKDHSVFFGFAPKYNPKIAIAVYVEYGGWGASYGAPIASLLVEKYLNQSCSRKELETRMKNTTLTD